MCVILTVINQESFLCSSIELSFPLMLLFMDENCGPKYSQKPKIRVFVARGIIQGAVLLGLLCSWPNSDDISCIYCFSPYIFGSVFETYQHCPCYIKSFVLSFSWTSWCPAVCSRCFMNNSALLKPVLRGFSSVQYCASTSDIAIWYKSFWLSSFNWCFHWRDSPTQ